ncbi:hypothetical protein ASG01_03500 [Chryseobacterium sp. Leaf180]|uniref:hypothetical protein n=1 Tax=Chryseobacterium sp. Leaf180 TaxID=1736289 RepID=UPI0006F3352B|nr:hypothetical protein [Chryseobacterium sp. Leaf180]KQR94942.1 hypothetical protein ASG01_03500 [Chryseobacterium sp. Leaf180]
MKKLLAIAFVGGLLVVNCGKKTENNLKDSNVMLEEPEAPVVAADSTKKTDSVPAAAIPNPSPSTDSTAAAK